MPRLKLLDAEKGGQRITVDVNPARCDTVPPQEVPIPRDIQRRAPSDHIDATLTVKVLVDLDNLGVIHPTSITPPRCYFSDRTAQPASLPGFGNADRPAPADRSGGLCSYQAASSRQIGAVRQVGPPSPLSEISDPS